MLYVPNATGRNKAEAGPCGRFEISWNGALVGHVSLVGRTRREAAIGYEIRLKYRRRGFASEAVAAVMSAAPGFGLSRVMAQCRSDNIASRGVLLKSGFALTSSVPWQTNGDSPLLERLDVYLWRDSRINVVVGDFAHRNPRPTLTRLAKEKPTYIILDPPREPLVFAASYPRAVKVAEFPKPGGESAIVIYEWPP